MDVVTKLFLKQKQGTVAPYTLRIYKKVIKEFQRRLSNCEVTTISGEDIGRLLEKNAKAEKRVKQTSRSC